MHRFVIVTSHTAGHIPRYARGKPIPLQRKFQSIILLSRNGFHPLQAMGKTSVSRFTPRSDVLPQIKRSHGLPLIVLMN